MCPFEAMPFIAAVLALLIDHSSEPPSFAASNPLQNFTFLQEIVGNGNLNTLQLYHTARSF